MLIVQERTDPLPDSVVIWASAAGRIHHVNQDHAVHIPRAVQRLVRWMVGEHMFRS